MPKQMGLWPTQEVLAQSPNIWKNLDQQQKELIITSLAKLINKIVRLQHSPQSREVNNE